MKLTVDGETFEAAPEKLTNVEGMAIERATGMTFTEWTDSLAKGSMLGLTALVWVMRRRTNPGLRFDDVEFALADLTADDEDEAAPKDPVVLSKTA